MRALIAGSIQAGRLRWVVFHVPDVTDTEIDAFCAALVLAGADTEAA